MLRLANVGGADDSRAPVAVDDARDLASCASLNRRWHAAGRRARRSGRANSGSMGAVLDLLRACPDSPPHAGRGARGLRGCALAVSLPTGPLMSGRVHRSMEWLVRARRVFRHLQTLSKGRVCSSRARTPFVLERGSRIALWT